MNLVIMVIHALVEYLTHHLCSYTQVDMPDAVGREQILRVLLSQEVITPDFDFSAVAARTDGYSGSDLKVGPVSCAVTIVLCLCTIMHSSIWEFS